MKHIAKQLRDLADQIESDGQHHAPETSKLIHKHFGSIIGDLFDRNCMDVPSKNPHDNMGAFVWKKSPEGYDFWRSIYDIILKKDLT